MIYLPVKFDERVAAGVPSTRENEKSGSFFAQLPEHRNEGSINLK